MADAYTARIEIRAPAALPEAVAEAARRKMTTPSEYSRQAIIERLRADGIDPTKLEPEAA